MKRFICFVQLIIVYISIFATPWDGAIATGYAGGTGSSGSPYLIATPQQLAYLAQQANAANANTVAKYFKLTADIDLNNLAWTPIGTNATLYFGGIFDGDNHSIFNLLVNRPTTDYNGLFGYVVGTASVNAIIKNINIASGSVTGQSYNASIAGRANYAQLINCKNAINITGSVSSGGPTAGGIVGTLGNVSIIEYCSNSGAVKGTGAGLYVGGIVGNSGVSNAATDYSYIRYCYNTGSVSAVSNAGGIAGTNSGNLTIKECFNTGLISVSNSASGGIVGYGYGLLSILNCYNTGAVKQTGSSTNSFNGGILGYPGGNAAGKYFKTINNCYNLGTVTYTGTGGNKEAIAGSLSGGSSAGGSGTVVNCYYLSSLSVSSVNGGVSKTTSELQDAGFISLINNSQLPVLWSQDAASMNNGYPVLMWQTSPKPKPSYQLSNFAKSIVTSSSVSLSWTAALSGSQPADGYLLKVSTGIVTDPVDGVDPADIMAVTNGNANQKIAPASVTAALSFSNMLAGSMYNYKIYSYNNSGANIVYNTTSAPSINIATLPADAKGVNMASTGATTADISWNLPSTYNSSGMSTLVFLKAAGTITAGTPTADPSQYSASPVFGSGTVFQNDASAYCVYSGDSSKVSVSGLDANTKYHVAVFIVMNASNYDASYSWSAAATEAIFWTGNANSDWSNPSNWSSNTVPESKDQVVIAGGYNPLISTNVGSVDKLTLVTTGDNVQPKLTINATGSFAVSSDTPNQTQISLQGGAIENNGTLSITAASGVSNGISFLNSAGNFVAASSYSGTGNLTINTSASGNAGSCISFTQTDANPSFTTNGTVNLIASSGMYSMSVTAGNPFLSGSGTINAGDNVAYGLIKINALNAPNSLTIGSGLTLNSYSSGFSTTSAPVYLGTAFGNKLINNGTINVGGGSANGIYSEPTAITNEISNNGTLTIGGFLSQSCIYLGGTGTTTLTNTGTISINGNNTAEGITVKSNTATATITNSGNITFGTTGSQTRAIGLGDGKTIFNNSGTITIGKGSISGLIGNGKAQFNNLKNGIVNFASPWTKTSNVNDVQLVGTSNLGFLAEKVRNKLPVTLCYLGGSITQGTGASTYSNSYYSKSSAAIIAEITKRGSTATSFNAGVGGTPSSYGAYRVGAQVLTHNPDFLVVEFAVNDASSTDLNRIDGMEGIVRQAIRQNPKISIVFLYNSMSSYQTTYYANGIVPPSVQAFHKVAQKYGITEVLNGPNINTGLINGDYTLATFFPDGTHPSDIGHALYANALSSVVIQGLDQAAPASDMSLTGLVGTGGLEYARLDAISPIGTPQYWAATKNWYGVPVYTTDSLAKPISFLGKGEGIILKYNGKISVSWTVGGVPNYKELTPTTGLPYPNTYTFSPNPDGAIITVQAIVNTGVATHGEVWGLFSVQRPSNGNGSGKMSVRSFSKIKSITSSTLAGSETSTAKITASTLSAVVNDSTGIANDVAFNNNEGTLSGYCGIVADNFSGTGIISPGGNGIGKLNFYTNTTGGTFALNGTYIANANGKTVAGKDYDQLNLASADGILDISGLSLSFTANYSPQLNDTIPLITASKSIIGRLSSTNLPANWHLLYDTKSLKAIYDSTTFISTTNKNNFIAYGISNAIVINHCESPKITICNSLGQLIQQTDISDSKQIVEIKKGIYFVSENGDKFVKVIVY